MRRPDLHDRCATARAWIRRLALPCAFVAQAPAYALQIVEARDGVAVEAIVSLREPTRIRIEGAPIIDVLGSIHTSNCSGTSPGTAGGSVASMAGPTINPVGEVVLECDRDKGEIYIRPVGATNKPINLFIASAHATYTLVLRRSDTPADTTNPRSGC